MPVLTRRNFGAAALSFGVAPHLAAAGGTWPALRVAAFERSLARLEQDSQGRLGVHVLDSASGQQAGHRSDQRFLMLSSFKTLAAALVLARHDRGEDRLDRPIPIQASDLIETAPVVERHVGASLTLAQLCEATLTTSDNAAANLILASYGGPAALTRFVRSLGDTVTRHDRTEPTLNQPDPHALLDTTSPRAMATTLRALLFGDALSPASRQQLQAWLIANTTGGKRLRAGLPPDWQVGEKTGTATRVGANDAGFARPPHGTPVLISAYLQTTRIAPAQRDEILATVGRLAAELVQG